MWVVKHMELVHCDIPRGREGLTCFEVNAEDTHSSGNEAVAVAVTRVIGRSIVDAMMDGAHEDHAARLEKFGLRE